MPDPAQIETLVGEFFRAFDSRAGAVPSIAALVGLFTERAVICQHRAGGCEFFSPAQFARPRVELLSSGRLREFHEWELQATTTIRGPVAMRVSRYAKAGLMDGADYAGQGTKLFQLAQVNGTWRILSLSWFDDPG
ncbi:MAG: DUF4440 domain-containing protein [Proteobacteria bacterium]|nr:DUF4440 domain-containing protein [Pseudomonadota bacterium]